MKHSFSSLFIITILTAASTACVENYHTYTWANYLQFNKEFSKAQRFYEPILASKPLPYVYKGYIHFLSDTNQWKKIVDLVNEYDAFFQNDLEVQTIFAHAFENMGNQTMYDERLVKLHDTFKHNMDLAIAAVQMYVRRKEPENALLVIDNYLEKSSEKANTFIFYFLKSQIFIQLNKRKEALESVHKSIELYPKFDKSWLMLAILEEQAGRMEQAAHGYMRFLEETNEPKESIKQHVSQLIKQYNINPSTYTPKSSCHDQALKMQSEGKYQEALAVVEACLQKEPHNQALRLSKIDLLALTKQVAKAAELLLAWILENPDNAFYYEALYLLGQKGLDTQQLIHCFKTIEKKTHNNQLAVLYLSDLYLKTHHAFGERYLKKALYMTTDTQTRVKILYQLAVNTYKKRSFKEAKQHLLTIYSLNKDFLPAINLLAYYYASKENNLPHAFMLIEQVTLKEPHNAHYLDTKAFILYKQGNYQQAYTILENCLNSEKNDFSILKHTAKVLYRLGNVQQACTFIKQAIAVGQEYQKRKLTTLLQRWTDESRKHS